MPDTQAVPGTPSGKGGKSPGVAAGGPGGPTPVGRRALDQEEFNRKLKQKRALFSNKRSLSLAAFKLSVPSVVKPSALVGGGGKKQQGQQQAPATAAVMTTVPTFPLPKVSVALAS